MAAAENANVNLQAQLPQGVAKHPPTYNDKMSFPSWFKKFQNYCDLLQVNNNNKYQTMLCFMDQDAFDTIQALNLTQNERNNIEDNATYIRIKNALKSQDERIPPDLLLKHRAQREGETIAAYSKALVRLAMDAFPNDQNIMANRTLIQAFITGVNNDELGIQLLRHAQFQTLTEAINTANEWLGALKTRRFIKTESTLGSELSEKVYNMHVRQKEDTTQGPASTECTNPFQNKTQNIQHTANCQCHLHNVQQQVQQNHIQYQPTHCVNTCAAAMHAQQQFQPNSPTSMNNVHMQPSTQQPIQHPVQLGRHEQLPIPGLSFPPHNSYFHSQRQPAYYNRNSRRNNFQYNNAQSKQSSDIFCYYCGKAGHIKNQCFALKRYMQRYCTYCNKHGHEANSCRFLNNYQQQNEQRSQTQPGNTSLTNNPATTDNTSKNPFRPS